MPTADYEHVSSDWRDQLKRNERRTKSVILSFIGIFLCVGLIVDVYILQSSFPKASIGLCLWALLTFKIFPIATFILGAVSCIAIAIAFALYDKIMLLGTDYFEVTPKSARNLNETQLYNVVEEMKVAAGLKYIPRVYVIEANYMNAFATGYSEKSALVAITRGLMEKLDRAELQAVMAHELSHIRHQDIKLTLAISVLSNILLIVLDMLFYSVLFNGNRSNQRDDNRLFTIILILRYVVPLITVLLTLFLSRTREYMADSGAVELMRDNDPMARALLKISQDHMQHQSEYTAEYGNTPHEQVRRASYLFDPSDLNPMKSLHNAFSTHPSIEKRLKAIGFKLRKSSSKSQL